jgi:hypothetical protein
MPPDAPLEPPYIVTKGRRTYYVAADGSAWRVRDTFWEARRHREVSLGNLSARYRLFTTPDGQRQVYEFADDEGREISERDFDRQLRTSKLEPRSQSPDPDAQPLRPGERIIATFTEGQARPDRYPEET